jgi:hypothetical protein
LANPVHAAPDRPVASLIEELRPTSSLPACVDTFSSPPPSSTRFPSVLSSPSSPSDTALPCVSPSPPDSAIPYSAHLSSPPSPSLPRSPRARASSRQPAEPVTSSLVTESDISGAIRCTRLASQLIGLPVRFKFAGHGFFDGLVTAFDVKEDFGDLILHQVTFSDGDQQEYNYQDLLRGHECYQTAHKRLPVVAFLQPPSATAASPGPALGPAAETLPLPSSFTDFPIRATFDGGVTVQGLITERRVSGGVHYFHLTFSGEHQSRDHWIDLSTLHRTFDTLKKESKISLPAKRLPELAPVWGYNPLAAETGWTTLSPLVGLTVAVRLAVDPFNSAPLLEPNQKRQPKHIATVTIEAVLPGTSLSPEQYWGRIHGDLTYSIIFPNPQSLAEAAHVLNIERLHQRHNRFKKRTSWLSGPQAPSSPSEHHTQRNTIQKLSAFFQTFPANPIDLFDTGFRISSRSVPKEALFDYRRGLNAVARLITDNPDNCEAWALFFLYDALTLSPARSFARAIRRRVSLIFLGDWPELASKHVAFRRASPVAFSSPALFDDPLDLIASRADYHLSVNHSVRGASNALQAPVNPPAPVPGQVTATLRKLNPQVGDELPPTAPPVGPKLAEADEARCRRPIAPPLSPPIDPVSFSVTEIFRKVRRSNTSSAGGPTGTTYKTLRSWFFDLDETSKSLSTVINLIAAGKVPEAALPLLNAGRGVAIPKNEAGDLRPIVVGHILPRLIGSLALEKLKEFVQRYFLERSIQFGASTADGCSLVAAAIEAFLEKYPWAIDIASDAKNAFNSYCRSKIWSSLDEFFPALSPFVRLIYGRASDILISEGPNTVAVPSSVGSRQGCSLGSFLFCLAIHPYLEMLQREYPDLLIVAYCDDVHVVGPPGKAIEAYHRWAYLYSCALQGELRNDKGIVYAPGTRATRADLVALGLPSDMPVTHDGVRILGAPVGTDDFCRGFAKDVIAKVVRDLGITSRMRSLQNQHTLTTKSTMHRVTFLCRNIWGGEPGLFDAVKSDYDAALLNVVRGISKYPSLTESARLIAQLPTSAGGLGYRTMDLIADPASLAAYVSASRAFPDLFPTLADMVPPVQQLLVPTSPLSKRARMACSALSRLMKNCVGTVETIVKHETGTLRGLQFALTALLDRERSIRLLDLIRRLDNQAHPRNMALFLSNMGDAHSFALAPFDRATQVPNCEFQVMVQRRLLLPVEHRDPRVRKWMCPACHITSEAPIRDTTPAFPNIDSFGDHALRCLRGMPFRADLWHNPLVVTLNDIGRRGGFRMQMEAHGSVPDTQKRPDNFAVNPDGTIQIAIDVRTCVTTSPTNCIKAAQAPFYAADQGTAIKERSWLRYTDPGGLSFVPFCVEDGGRFGDTCLDLLDRFASAMSSLDSAKQTFKTFALFSLHLTNQRGVARVINALRPIAADPHVVTAPTTYELPPPPPRPQLHSSAPTPPPRRPRWASSPIKAPEQQAESRPRRLENPSAS